jgi:hypothetical protein
MRSPALTSDSAPSHLFPLVTLGANIDSWHNANVWLTPRDCLSDASATS